MPVEPIEILIRQLESMTRSFFALLPSLFVALLLIVITYFVAKGARLGLERAMRRLRLRPSLKTLFGNLTSIGIWTAGILIAGIVVIPGLTPSGAIAGLGFGTVAIGFAFKDIFENFLAGIIILFRREMRIGDFIECEGLKGKIERITIRETYIRQTDGQLVIAPNSFLFKNPLTIVTDLDVRRVTITAGVAYGEDVDESRAVITKAVEGCETVIHEAARPIQIFAKEFNSSSIDFEVTWWTGSRPVDERRSRDEVIAAVKRGLDEAGIEIPFPYRTLTFKEPLRIGREDADRGDGEGA